MAAQGSLRIVVDREACCGYGACKEACPELYQLDARNLVVVTTDIVPAGLEEKAQDGADVCPQGAITLETIT